MALSIWFLVRNRCGSQFFADSISSAFFEALPCFIECSVDILVGHPSFPISFLFNVDVMLTYLTVFHFWNLQSEKEADCFAAFQRKAELMVEIDALKLRMRDSQVCTHSNYISL